MSKAWPRVKLGEVLRRSEEKTVPIPGQEYREITVRLWGKGVIERSRTNGGTLSGNRFIARAGQFIISRIDARNGAMGLVPEALDGALVTNDFPLFSIETTRLVPAFMEWLSRTRSFVELCQHTSEGTTNRVRLQEDKFLAREILLPPLAEQQRIVARIENLSAQIHKARSSRELALWEAEVLMDSYRRNKFGMTSMPHWILLSEYVATIENGKSPATEGRPASDDEWGVLKVGAVSFGSFNEKQNKALPIAYTPLPSLEVKPGDFLMSRANTRELVGACAMVRESRPKLMLSDKTFRFVFRSPRTVLPEYLEQVLKSPALREQIEREASGTSPTMKNISKAKVLSLLLPPMTLSEQRKIVAELNALRSEVNALRCLQTKTVAELDSLLPAILDRAFKGEL